MLLAVKRLRVHEDDEAGLELAAPAEVARHNRHLHRPRHVPVVDINDDGLRLN